VVHGREEGHSVFIHLSRKCDSCHTRKSPQPQQAVVHLPGCLLMEESTLTGRLGLRPLTVPASWQTAAEEVGGVCVFVDREAHI
jgi:hypothetical protein